LLNSNLIQADDEFKKLARPHPPTEMLRFDHERSRLPDIPVELRKPVLRIFLEHADGAVKMSGKKWISFDVLNTPEINDPYPFEPLAGFSISEVNDETHHRDYLWEEMTWPVLRDRLKIVNIMVAHLVRFIEELKKSSLDEIFQKKY
jgi:hypothetical protein